jgi:hypothetical protein
MKCGLSHRERGKGGRLCSSWPPDVKPRSFCGAPGRLGSTVVVTSALYWNLPTFGRENGRRLSFDLAGQPSRRATTQFPIQLARTRDHCDTYTTLHTHSHSRTRARTHTHNHIHTHTRHDMLQARRQLSRTATTLSRGAIAPRPRLVPSLALTSAADRRRSERMRRAHHEDHLRWWWRRLPSRRVSSPAGLAADGATTPASSRRRSRARRRARR